MTAHSDSLMDELKKNFKDREAALIETLSAFKSYSDFIKKIGDSQNLKREEKKGLFMAMMDETKYHIIKFLDDEMMN